MIVGNSFPSFFDLLGEKLENGSVYLGEVGKNPETNPIQVYWDSDCTQGAAQPLKTIGGTICRDGTPANIYVKTAYSITVRDKKGRLVFSMLDSTSFDSVSAAVSESIKAALAAVEGVVTIPMPIASGGTNSTSIDEFFATFGIKGAALKDAGTLGGQVLLMTDDNKLPALDASNLFNIPASTPPVRQTVLGGNTDSSGYANALSVGTGLALNLSATAKALRIAFAAGAGDAIATLSADAANIVTALTPNVTSYISCDFVNNSTVTWNKTLAPVQYGYAYDRTQQTLLHFDGVVGSTTMLDDFGNSWNASGGAKLQSNQSKFGGTALGGAGTNNALNGTSDQVVNNSFVPLGYYGWTLRGWFYITSLAAQVGLFGANNASNYGAQLQITTAGKTRLTMSSTGSSQDIASATLGTATVTANAWHYFELCYNASQGKYYLYYDGTLDQTITDTGHICATTKFNLGNVVDTAGANHFMPGYIDEFEILPYCERGGSNYVVPTAAPNITTQGYASDFFSISEMLMYQVSAAAAVNGSDPSLTAKTRVYVGECTTGAAAVSSVTTYGYNGRYSSTAFAVTGSTTYSKNHNLGLDLNLCDFDIRYKNSLALSWKPALSAFNTGTSTLGYNSRQASSKNSVQFNTVQYVGYDEVGNAASNGFYQVNVKRKF